MPVLRALVPVAGTCFRVAYEIGDFLANQQQQAKHDPQGAANICNHVVGIILEEAQRFLFNRFVDVGLRSIERLVTDDVPNLAQGLWDGLLPQRRALADVLRRMPAEPYQPTDDNLSYWSDLIARTASLIAALPSSASDEVTRGLAITYAAAELLTEATRNRVNRAQAYAFAIGAGTASTPRARFTDGLPVSHQPRDPLLGHINRTIGNAAGQRLDYPDLLSYLMKDAVVDTLRSAAPEVDGFLSVFDDPRVAGGISDVVLVLLRNREAFLDDPSGNRDPKTTLALLLGLIDVFVTDEIKTRLVPLINDRIPAGNVRLFFNEVIVGTLIYTKNIAFGTILTWEQQQFLDESAFKEALAAVLTMLLGRSLVLVGDSFMAAMQADMQRACAHAASKIEGPRDPFTAMNIPASPELKALFADTLRIGGEVFGPLPADVRRNLRFVLYDVMETLPPTAAAQADLLTNLADQFFVPNQDSMKELSDQLLAISCDRFQLFVERVLEAGADLVLAALQAFLDEAARTIQRWLDDLDQALRDLREDILRLAQQIHGLIVLAERAFDEAADRIEETLHDFSSSTFRRRLRDRIGDAFYDKGKAALADNPFYRSLPGEIRRGIRRAMRDVIDDVLGGAVIDPILDVIGNIAGEVDDVFEDVRELNPSQPLAPQLLDLLVDRMEDRIRDAFGGSKPHINIGFDIGVFGASHHFGLGRVDLKFGSVFSILRSAVNALNFYEANLNAAAAALADAFAQSLALEQAQKQHDAKAADRERLQAIRNEAAASPKSITIVNPVQSLVYDDDLGVEIHLGGVPASYLGLNKDEQGRVFVFLNGELIPSSAIALDTVFADLGSGQLLAPVDVSRLPTFDLANQAVVGNRASIHLRAQPRVAAKPAVATVGGALPLRRSLQAPTTGRAALSSRPLTGQRFGRTGGGTPVTSGRLGNVLPGRRMTPTKRDLVTQALPPGITLQFDVGIERLAEGSNTLAVVVIDPDGQRYQQVVSFAVVGHPKIKRPAPTLPTVKPAVDRKPIANKDRIDLHFQAKAIGARVEAGRAFVEQHAITRLQGLRPNVRGRGPDVA
jgi:hypothetical protein